MFGEEISEEKSKKMFEYLDEETKKLSPSEDAEFSKRCRIYYSAWQMKQDYFEKIKKLEETREETFNTRKKDTRNSFIVFFGLAIASYIFNWTDTSERSIVAVIFIMYFFDSQLMLQLDGNNYRQLLNQYQIQIDNLQRDISEVNCGYVEYESDYLNRSEEDDEKRKIIQNLYRASVEIKILHGLKTNPPFVRF